MFRALLPSMWVRLCLATDSGSMADAKWSIAVKTKRPLGIGGGGRLGEALGI